jgi:hypothetical protein
MAQAVSVEQHDINAVAGGGAITLTTSSIFNLYRLYTDTTITAAATVVASDVPVGVVSFNILLDADITFGGAGSFSVFGTSIPERLLQKGTIFTAVYNGSSYVVSTSTPLTVSDVVANTNVVDNTITLGKLALVTAGYIIVANGSGQFTAVAMSGDIAIDNAGVVTIANDAVTTVKIIDDAVTTPKIVDEAVTLPKLDTSLQAYFSTASSLIYKTVTIGTADVLTGNSTPVEVIGAVAGKIIMPLFVLTTLTYNSAAYTTNLRTQIIYNGATDALLETPTQFLGGTTTKTVLMDVNTINGATDTQVLSNAALNWSVQTGDPLAGDSDITLSIVYILLDA